MSVVLRGILNSERNNITYAGESDFAFAPADAIRTDYVAYVKGYPGHQSRCAVVDRPSKNSSGNKLPSATSTWSPMTS
jgi:hypothetical protein